MEPFYFGTESALFGCYHEATGTARDRAVLVPSPVLNEYARTHWALKTIANKAANAGFDVLRFDFFACGNSRGQSTEITLNRWIDDVACAVEELTDISGVSKVSVVATRFAAALSGQLAADTIDQFIAWDPIWTGPEWLTHLQVMRESFAATQVVEKTLRPTTQCGFEVGEQAWDGATQLQPRPGLMTGASQITTTKANPEGQHVEFDCDWQSPDLQMLYPHPVIDSIRTVLCQ